MIAVLGILLFTRFRFGAQVACIGDNIEAAREMGIRFHASRGSMSIPTGDPLLARQCHRVSVLVGEAAAARPDPWQHVPAARATVGEQVDALRLQLRRVGS